LETFGRIFAILANSIKAGANDQDSFSFVAYYLQTTLICMIMKHQ
jgi:hypothetical protein